LATKNLVGEAIAASSKVCRKSLYHLILLASYQNGVKKGVSYALGHAVNHSSRKFGQLLKFTILSEVDAKDFVYNGEKPFEMLPD
jgi:hypothetical protein